MELYIVRHGETIWNSHHLLQGRMDIELNEKGRAIAGDTGRNLENVMFDKIYSSPLIRAYETACLIRGHRNIPIIRDDRLKELCFGVNEGKNMQELEQDKSSSFCHFFNHPECYNAPEEGESLQALCERAKDFLVKEIEPQKNLCDRIMIVGHGALNKALMCHIKQHDIEKFWSGGLQKNCNVMIVSYEDTGYRVIDETRLFY